MSSWQSRNPEIDRYGGAIWLRNYGAALSLSGLPELHDKAFAASLAFFGELIEFEYVLSIRDASDNYFILPSISSLETA